MAPENKVGTPLDYLEAICREAIKAGASDIHLKAGLPPMVRVNGALASVPGRQPSSPELLARMAWDLMGNQQREVFRKDNDLDLSWEVKGVGRFRLNILRQRGLVGLVLRTIPAHVQSIDELALPDILKTLAREPRGLVLVTGATGSGKSTTLAAMVEEINRQQTAHIVTIEDPIEFIFRERRSIINQREVGSDTASFAQALRAALRQDPDVILVGELRDRPSMEMALAAAETGHLVLSTVHSLNAPEAINRIVNFFEMRYHNQIRMQLAGTLRAIISQRLVPRRTGGRVAALEVMLNTGTVADCIRDPARLREIQDLAEQGHEQYGSQTFDQALFEFWEQEIITGQEALRHANSPDNMALRMSGIGTD